MLNKLTTGRIVALYIVLASLWILISDRFLLAFVDSPVILTQVQIVKGILYVIVTGSLLYVLIESLVAATARSERTLRRTAARLENLRAIDRAILEAESPGAIVRGALSRLRQLVPYQRTDVVLFNFELEEAIVFTIDANGERGPADGRRLSLNDFHGDHSSITHTQTHEPRYIKDLPEYHKLSPRFSRLAEMGIRSILAVPLGRSGQLLGELHLCATTPSAFDGEQVEMVKEVADQLSVAIQQARMHAELERRASRLEALFSIQHATAQSLEMERVLRAGLETTIRKLQVDAGAVHLLDTNDTLTLRAHKGLSQRWVNQLETIDHENGIVAQAVRERKPIIHRAANHQADSLPPLLVDEQFKCLASTPLLARGSPIGAITLASRSESFVAAREERLLGAIGQQLGQSVQNSMLYQAEQRRHHELDALYDLSRQLVSIHKLDVVFETVVRHTAERAHVTFCRLLLFDDGALICRAAHTVRALDFDLRVGETVAPTARAYYERAFEHNYPLVIDCDQPDLSPEQRQLLYLDVIHSLCVAPLRAGDERIGLLVLGERRRPHRETYTDDKLRLVAAIADQTSSAIRQAALYEQLETQYVETVLALSGAIDAHDTYTATHSRDLSELAVATARILGCDEQETRIIQWGALLHDIGKIGVPDSILQKPGPLSADEWKIMRRHPDIGADIVARVEKLTEVAPLIRAHQERYDGQGYPEGLTGDAIPLGARILAVVDAYSAITEDRPYQKARSHDEAVAELRRCAGSQFDPEIVEAFLRILKQRRI